MSYKAEQLLVLSGNFEKLAAESLKKSDKKKSDKKDSKKSPPKDSKKKDSKESKKSTKKASEYYDSLLNTYGQSWTDKLKNLNPFGKTKATPPPPGGYGLVQPPPSAEDTSGPGVYSPPKAMNAPAEREQQVTSYVKEVFDPRVNKWFPTDDKAMSTLPEGTRARYHSGEEYVYFTKTKAGWDEEGAKPFAPSKAGPANYQYRAEVESAQKVLNDMTTRGKLNVGVSPDGKLGPKTQNALKAYKAYVGVPSMTDEQAIKALNTPHDQHPITKSVQQQNEEGTLKTMGDPPMGGRDETVITNQTPNNPGPFQQNR